MSGVREITRQGWGARSNLETLRAAINHHGKENLHHGLVRVALPPKEPEETDGSRARRPLVCWACWRYRETQTVRRSRRWGARSGLEKRPLRHLARFILIKLSSGTRAGAIAPASPYRNVGNSFVDIDQGIFFRQAIGGRAGEKGNHLPPFPHACWNTCGAGFAEALSLSFRRIKQCTGSVDTNRIRQAVKLAGL